MIDRREWVLAAGLGIVACVSSRRVMAQAAAPTSGGPELTVYRDAGCGCCKLWVEHMKRAGFKVTAHDVADIGAVKRDKGVPESLASCHTGLVGGYLVEGHVPGDLVQQMLAAKPAIMGLAVPGMPMGSPGMEGPRKDPYDVIAFEKNGKTTVYAKR
jgi:hypothetical protein